MNKLLMTKDNKQLLSLEQTQIIKGIAILCVIVCHFGGYYTRFLTPLGGIGVALFLFVSGYGLCVSYEKQRERSNTGLLLYWRKRLIGVCVPYAIIEIISIIFSIQEFSVRSFILDIFLIRPKFLLGWYLNYLLLWYIIFWMIHKIIEIIEQRKCMKISSNKKTMVWIVLAIILAIYFNFTSSLRFEQSFSFVTGIICAYYPFKAEKNFNWKRCIGCFLIAFLLLAFKQTGFARNSSQTVLNIIDLLMKYSAALSIIMFVLLSMQKLKKLSIILTSIGKVSYELYLIHGLALVFLTTYGTSIRYVCTFWIISIFGTIIFNAINSKSTVLLKERYL